MAGVVGVLVSANMPVPVAGGVPKPEHAFVPKPKPVEGVVAADPNRLGVAVVDVVVLPKLKPPAEAVDVAGVEPKLKPEEAVVAAGAPKLKPVDAGVVDVAVTGVAPKLNPEDEAAGALPKPKPVVAGVVELAGAGVATKENEDEPVDVEIAAGALLPKLKPPVDAAGAAGVVAPKEKPAEFKSPWISVSMRPQYAMKEPQEAHTLPHAEYRVR